MKKIHLLLIPFLALVFLSSCKKDRVCTCTISSNQPGSTATIVDFTFVDARKSDAKKACVKITQEDGTYTTTQDCVLK